MKVMWLGVTLLLASLASAASPKPADEFVEIKAGEAFTVRPDRAYLLFRTNSKETRVFLGVSPVFLRIPTTEEMAIYEAAKRSASLEAGQGSKKRREDFVYEGIRNIHSVSLGRALEKPKDGPVMLIEARPGDYVLYGWGTGDLLYTCLCLGTVSFHAAAGKITDLGTLLLAPAAEPSSTPELKAVTGLGASVNGTFVLWASAIRPVDGSTPIPAVLAGKPIVPADYRASGKFVSPFAAGIHRLAPIPGVLGYDGGTVLDLVSRTAAADHYE